MQEVDIATPAPVEMAARAGILRRHLARDSPVPAGDLCEAAYVLTGWVAADPCDCGLPMASTSNWWWLVIPAVALVGSLAAALIHARRSRLGISSTPGDPVASAAAEPDHSR